MGEQGWPFASVDPYPGADLDPLYGSKHVKDLYFKAEPSCPGRSVRFTSASWDYFRKQYSCRFTVPVLWDKKNQTIVNNESSEIIRIFNTEFNEILPKDKAEIDIYPKALREEIDSANEWVYDNINSQHLSPNSLQLLIFFLPVRQMGFTKLGSQRPQKRTRLRSIRCSKPWTKSKRSSRAARSSSSAIS